MARTRRIVLPATVLHLWNRDGRWLSTTGARGAGTEIRRRDSLRARRLRTARRDRRDARPPNAQYRIGGATIVCAWKRRTTQQRTAAGPGEAAAPFFAERYTPRMDRVFFDSWQVLLRTAIVGVMAYATLVILLRVSGKRTLSKMNAFDFVVTVALGSTLASILTGRDVALAQGALAFALLIGLQFLITWSSVRVRWIRRTVTGEPVLLLYRGGYLQESLRHARVTEDERAGGRPLGGSRIAR